MSQYRQIGVVLTEDSAGLARIRVRVKPREACWSNHDTVLDLHSAWFPQREDLADTLRELSAVLQQSARSLEA